MSRSRLVGLAALMASVALGAVAHAAPEPTLTEAMSYDGLQKTTVKGIDLAYVRPGATLAAYRSVQLEPVQVSFYKNWNPDVPGTPWKLSTEQRDNIKTTVAKLVMDSFVTKLKKAGYPVVDAPGPDVLLVDIYIINLDIPNPAVMTPDTATFSNSAVGQATIYAELHDSQTGQIIARIIDTQVAQNDGMALSNSVENYAAGQQVADKWADLLVRGLDRARETASR